MIKHNKNMKDLVSFQSDNKYLFMAYNQVKQKGIRAYNCKSKMKRLKLYLKTMRRLYMNYLCALYIECKCMRAHFGYFKTKLKTRKDHFIELLQKYAEKKIPLSSLLTILKSWAIRFDEKYLLRQTYFEPYPEALVEISDSGKGRDY